MKNKRNTTKEAETYDVTVEDVIASQLIPELDPMNLQFIGKCWFKDNATGVAYHFIKNDSGEVSVKGTRQSVAKTKAALRAAPKPPKVKLAPKLVDIKCVDCGAMRTVKPQDVFQVKRCVGCQSKHRLLRRQAHAKGEENTVSA